MPASREDTFNVMVLSILIVLIVIAGSIVALWFLTGDLYLDSYFTLESFFDVQNTAAATDLAALVFSQKLSELVPVLIIVAVDNISRILMVSFIIAAVIDFLNYANIEGLINRIKSGRLRGHVILCGYNDITERLIKKLRDQGTPYVVIAPEKEKERELNEKRILSISGDFAKDEVLMEAKIDRAVAIVFVSESNVDNVVGSIVARRLNPRIKVLSRLGDDSVRKKVYGIGTDMAVIPEHLAGIEMGEYIARARGA